MGILSWIVMGLIVGLLAKFIMPGKDPGGNHRYDFDRDSRSLPGWVSWVVPGAWTSLGI